MGQMLSSMKADTKDAVSRAVMRSKLVDLKAKKSQRDQELAFRVATVRERCHWLLGFYAFMIAFNAGRLRYLREVTYTPLPLAWFPYVATPVLFAYQADLAYGNKLERLNIEAQHIIKNERHWFNKPMRLPKSMESEYRRMHAELRARCPEEPPEEWAVFSDEITKEEIYENTFPATRFLSLGDPRGPEAA